VKRGEIWWTDLGEPRGAQPAFRRPVVVVQDDLLTESRLATVMVVPLTTNLKRAVAIGNVSLEPKESGLVKPCVALVCQVMCIDKLLLDERVRALPRRALREVDSGLSLALGLGARRSR
jgi:mRNA interferase MazF